MVHRFYSPGELVEVHGLGDAAVRVEIGGPQYVSLGIGYLDHLNGYGLQLFVRLYLLFSMATNAISITRPEIFPIPRDMTKAYLFTGPLFAKSMTASMSSGL